MRQFTIVCYRFTKICTSKLPMRQFTYKRGTWLQINGFQAAYAAVYNYGQRLNALLSFQAAYAAVYNLCVTSNCCQFFQAAYAAVYINH